MNELFLALIASMKEEAVCYRRLALLAREQKELLIAGNVEAMPNNTRLQEKQVFALTPVVGRREELLAQLAKTLKVKAISLKEAASKAPAEVAESFKTQMNEMIQAAKDLAAITDISGQLLKNAMDYTQFTLKAIREGGKQRSFTMSVATEDKKPSFVNRVV